MWLLLIILLAAVADACRPIYTGPYEGYMNCSYEGLYTVPPSAIFNKTIQVLLMTGNLLSDIRPGMFTQNVSTLDVSSNMISIIRSGSFVALTLRLLMMHANFITYIEKNAFIGMTMLQNIFIYGNTPMLNCMPGSDVTDALTADARVWSGPSTTGRFIGTIKTIANCSWATTPTPTISNAAVLTTTDVQTPLWIGAVAGVGTGLLVFVASWLLVVRRRPKATVLPATADPLVVTQSTTDCWDERVYATGCELTDNPVYDNRVEEPDDPEYTELEPP